jgi:hypothetical protein
MASPERRLDQLRLADDTAFGLLLVWLYMVLDATQQNGVVSQWLIRWTDGAAADSRWTALPGLAQAGVMLGLAALIGYVRLRRLLRRVRPRKLSEMDAAFDDDATAIARRLVRRSPLFLATPSLTDTNACCVLRFPGNTSSSAAACGCCGARRPRRQAASWLTSACTWPSATRCC